MNFVKVFGGRNVEVEFIWLLHAVTIGDVPQQLLVQMFACLATVTLLLANLMLSFHIIMSFFRFTFLTWSLSVGRKSICTLYVHTNDTTIPWSNCVRSSAKSSAKYKNISCSVIETSVNWRESLMRGRGGGRLPWFILQWLKYVIDKHETVFENKAG